jgi:hypothetical protein
LAAIVIAHSAFAQEPATVKIGNEVKKTVGVVKQLDNGDIACYLVMNDEKGREFTELGDFDICSQKPSPVGKQVSLTYTMATVMSDECQGNPDCKKTKRVALVSRAQIIDARVSSSGNVAAITKPAAGQTSFCTPLEEVVFACRAGAKLVSVCASKGASRSQGYLQYRFGKPDSRDPMELMLHEGQPLPGKAASGESVPFAGGGGAWLRFTKAPFAYVVYSGIGKWGPKGETTEKQGVVVERGGKVIANIKCSGKLTTLLGPDWLERAGIQSHGTDFNFPD